MAILLNANVGDTNGDLLRMTAGLLNNNQPYTIMGWFKLTGDNNRTNVLWYFTNSPGAHTDYLATATDGTTLIFTSLSPAGGYTTFGSTLTPGTWYHIAVVRPSATAAPLIYVNGALSFTGQALNVGNRGIVTKFDLGGGNPEATSPFAGEVAEVKMWQAALTLPEIQADGYWSHVVRTANIYGAWTFEGSSNVRYLDISGQGHGWIIRGTPTQSQHPPRHRVVTIGRIENTPTVYATTTIREGAETIITPLLTSTPTIEEPTIIRHNIRIDLGSEARGAEYEYRGLLATEVELSYYPKQAYTGLLWQTKSEDPTKIKAGDKREIVVSPETAEGFKITPFIVNPFFVGGSTYKAMTAADEDANPPVVPTDVTALVPVRLYHEGQQIRLHWHNTTQHDVTVTAALYGGGYFSKDTQTLIISDPDLITMNRGRRKPMKLDMRLVADEFEAESIAYHLLALVRHQIDGVFSVRYEFGNTMHDQRRFEKISTIKVGDVIEVREEQSGIEYEPHIVLGESFSVGGGIRVINHTLLPIGFEE